MCKPSFLPDSEKNRQKVLNMIRYRELIHEPVADFVRNDLPITSDTYNQVDASSLQGEESPTTSPHGSAADITPSTDDTLAQTVLNRNLSETERTLLSFHHELVKTLPEKSKKKKIVKTCSGDSVGRGSNSTEKQDVEEFFD